MKRILAFVALCLFAALPACAQFSEELKRDLARLNAKRPEQWTERDFHEMERLTFAMSREVLLSGMTASERSRVAGLRIETVDNDSGPPASIDGDVIRVSTAALTDLIFLGFLLGHDVYVDAGESFPIRDTLTTHPYATSQILPLLNPLDVSTFYRMPQELMKCPNTLTQCAEPQASATVIGVIGFVIAHEMSHRLLNHGSNLNRSPAEELAADAKAWDILMKIAPTIEADDTASLEYRVRVAIEAGPRVFLRWLVDRTSAGNLKEQYRERLDKISGRATEDVDATVMLLADAGVVGGGIRSVTITWSERPDELFINGVPVAPSEVEGKPLQIMTSAHVFARRGSRFAYAEVRREPQATLTFVPLVDGASTSEIDRLRRERKWFDVFLRTATPDLQPRNPQAARRLRDALARFKMDRRAVLESWRPMR